MFTCLFVYLFICLFAYLFICLFICLFVYLIVYLFICLFDYLFICLFICLFILSCLRFFLYFKLLGILLIFYVVFKSVRNIRRIAKPLFLPLQNFRSPKTLYNFWLYWESSMNFEVAESAAGPAEIFPSHALCVFLCTPLFEPKWEPLEVNFC